VTVPMLAGALSGCASKLDSKATAQQLVRNTSAAAARCVPATGHWDYSCTMRFTNGSKLTVLVRVNGSKIVEQSGP
jgi:hypothetical protein